MGNATFEIIIFFLICFLAILYWKKRQGFEQENHSLTSRFFRFALPLAIFVLFIAGLFNLIAVWKTLRPSSVNETTLFSSPAPKESPDYESVEMGLEIEMFDDGFKIPTRLAFTHRGNLLLVSELSGKVWLYKREDNHWLKQNEPFYDLGNLNVTGERWLTGLFFGADFDDTSRKEERRDVFLSYQTRRENIFVNRITRVTMEKSSGGWFGVNPKMIFEGKEPSASAHQIQNGIGFIYHKTPHILIAIGDGFTSKDALDIEKEGHGKILLMGRDGKNPEGPRPVADHPKIQAIGL